MSELTLHLVSSIDGFIATEDGGAAPGARWDEAMQQSYLEDFNAADGIVFGEGQGAGRSRRAPLELTDSPARHRSPALAIAAASQARGERR